MRRSRHKASDRGRLGTVRRSLASLFFVAAAAAFSISAAAWWLENTVFDPEASSDVADAVLEDAGIRRQIATVIADHTANRLNLPSREIRAVVEQYAQTSQGGDIMAEVVADAQARLIGIRDEPVRISPNQLVRITRDERVAILPAVTLPVEEVRPVSIVRESTEWLIPIAAAIGAVAFLIGLVAHPARADAIFGIGALLVFVGLMAVLFGYVVPVALVPALNDSTWTAALPLIAKANSVRLFVGAALLAGAGTFLVVGSTVLKRRRQWRSPVTPARYYDQRHWS